MNLIYMCVFHQESYINLLKLLVTSISEKAHVDLATTDILVITSPEFNPLIQRELASINLPIQYHILDLHTLMEASCCKLKIFQYHNIDKYDKILYLDTDVLINSDVNVLFNIDISPDKVYALEEGVIGHEFWGGQFFDFSVNNPHTPAYSAGVLYFRNSPAMKELFAAANTHIASHMQNNSAPVCLDQPFLLYHSFTQQKYDNQLMKSYMENNPSMTSTTKIIYHFPGGPGDYASKHDKMTSFWGRMQTHMTQNILKNGFSMVSEQRLINLYNQCAKFRNTGHSFVECGVAKGGCLALMAHSAGPANKVFGFDSFEGMPAITKEDLGDYNKSDIFNGFGKVGDNLSGGVQNVYHTFNTLGVRMDNVELVKGFFNDTLTIQENIASIGSIAILRLDADWYESTKICLDKLYDKVITGGVIIIDDYGHWVGAKRAVDEFRTTHNIIDPLIQTDYTEHYWVKSDMNVFNTRNDMLKHYLGQRTSPKMVEIGVFKGDFLDYLVRNCNIGTIDAVDLFEGDTCSGDADGNNVVYYNVGKSYLELSEKYRDDTRVRLQKSDSVTFLQNQPDDTYDIVYIDGDHSYNGVKQDLRNAYKKIKNGGYIMGHDYEMNMSKAHTYYNFGVKAAVDEFCKEYNQTIAAKAIDGCVSFCIHITKPA